MWDQEKQNIERELNLGEQLLWTGRPRQGFIVRSSDAAIIPFSILWCGFAIFWESSVLLTDAPFFFRLWGIPFVLVGLYMVIGRFFVDRFVRSKTFYGITKERIIIVSGLFNRTVKSLNIRTLSDITLNEKSNGVGTISLGPATNFGQWGNWPFGNRQQIEQPALEQIQEAKRVYNIIREAQR